MFDQKSGAPFFSGFVVVVLGGDACAEGEGGIMPI